MLVTVKSTGVLMPAAGGAALTPTVRSAFVAAVQGRLRTSKPKVQTAWADVLVTTSTMSEFAAISTLNGCARLEPTSPRKLVPWLFGS